MSSESGATANRPLSPHLQVYKPQWTSGLSIFHRITGVALAVGTVLLVVWLWAASAGPDTFTAMQGFMGSWIGMLLLFGWSAALFYHLCNGIRHLLWDAGYGLELSAAYRSGLATLAATGVLTVLAWVIGLAVL